MHTSVSLPRTPEFAVSFGKVFELRHRNNLWNSGVHPETRFDLQRPNHPSENLNSKEKTHASKAEAQNKPRKHENAKVSVPPEA